MLGEMDVVRKGGESRQSILLYCGWGVETGGSMIKLLLRYIFPTITHITDYRITEPCLCQHFQLFISVYDTYNYF